MSHKEFPEAKVYTERIPNLKGSFSGVIGMTLLLYFYTYLTIGVLLLAGIAFQYRRKSHAKLYPRRP
jgi:hypothetical protein